MSVYLKLNNFKCARWCGRKSRCSALLQSAHVLTDSSCTGFWRQASKYGAGFMGVYFAFTMLKSHPHHNNGEFAYNEIVSRLFFSYAETLLLRLLRVVSEPFVLFFVYSCFFELFLYMFVLCLPWFCFVFGQMLVLSWFALIIWNCLFNLLKKLFY